MAEANSQRLIRLINDLLDIEKMEAGKLELAPQATPVQPIIDQSIAAVNDFAAQNHVTIETASTDAWVNADSDRVVQVLINFLSNAVKYSDKDSTVTIACLATDGAVEIRVIDRGRGIPPEFTEKIFDKFQQVDAKDKREKKGTGLGLAICKAIVEQHGGTIGVESAVGEGSTFWFTLPAATPVNANGSAVPITPASLAQS
jgi:signal transduction histidine kinase